MWIYLWTTVLNSNKYSLLMCWLTICCKFCLKKLDYYLVQIDKDKKPYELWNSIKVWRNMAKPLKYIEVCLPQGTSPFFFTRFINFTYTKRAAHILVKALQKLVCLQESKCFVIHWGMDKRENVTPGIAEHLLKSQPTLPLQRTLVHWQQCWHGNVGSIPLFPMAPSICLTESTEQKKKY